jgi:UDP-2,3-diacylglucosamine pyrophosphatase LpxH
VDRRFYVVSDLHLGDGSASDAFMGKDTQFLDFLEQVRGEGAHLVICGDIIDFPQAFSFTRVLRAHTRLFRGLAETARCSGITYVWGNHDYDIALYEDLLKWELGSCLEVGDEVLIEHGHRLDPYVGEYPRESATATVAHHLVERLLGTWIRFPLHHFYTRSNRLAWWSAYRSWQLIEPLRRAFQRVGIQGFGRRAEAFIHYWVRCQLGDSMCIFDPIRERLQRGPHRVILTGHSHLPGSVDVGEGRRYVNDGSWTFASSQYAVWDGREFEVRDWIKGMRYADENYRRLLTGEVARTGVERWWHDEYFGWLRFRCGHKRRRGARPGATPDKGVRNTEQA